MRTPDEIKRWLDNPIHVHYHISDIEPRLTPLALHDLEFLHADALAYISQLESQNRCFKEIKESCERRMIDMAQRMPSWISVEERLPEPLTDVVVIVRHGDGWQYTIGYVLNEEWHRTGGSRNFYYGGKITHWMPLPEPPQEN